MISGSSQDRQNNTNRRTGFLFAADQQLKQKRNKESNDDNSSLNGKDEHKYDVTPAIGSNTLGQSINHTITSNLSVAMPEPPLDDDDPLKHMFKTPVITLYSQKMKGLKDLLLAEKLNTHAISLQVTAQSVASRKVRGVDKLGNHTTNSTYSSANVGAAGSASSGDTSAAANDSIAVSRPKRTRRE